MSHQQQFDNVSTAQLTLPKTSGKGVKVDQDVPTFPWVDFIGQMRPDTGGANSPQLAALSGGACRAFFYQANDIMDFDVHIRHDYVPGSDVYVHLHWEHNGATITGNFTATITYSYCKGHSQGTRTAEKTVTVTYATVDIATTPASMTRIDEVQLSSAGGSATLIDSALIEPDGVFTMQVKLTSLPTITGGSPNKVAILYCDIHAQSTGIGTKQKAPPFYT